MRQGLITKREELCRAGFRQETENKASLPTSCASNSSLPGYSVDTLILLIKGWVYVFMDLPGEGACEVPQDLGEPLSSAGVGRVISCGIQRPSLYTPGSPHLQLQTVEVEDAHKAQWADMMQAQKV